jgi:hypothetical protein
MDEAIEETRSELAAAFEVIHSMEFHRGDKVVADPDKFKHYDLEKALSHVDNARGPLATVKHHAEGKKLKTRYGVLAGLALIAEEGAKLYDKLRKTFREGWQYEYVYKKAAYEESVEQIGEAQRFLVDIPTHRKEVADGIESVAGLHLAPKVDGFNLQMWADIEATIKHQTPALSAMFSGFKEYTEAVVYDNAGIDALENGDSEAAHDKFHKAVRKVGKSKTSLETAKQREASFFDDRLDMYHCEISGMKQAYTYHLQAATALAEGDKEKSRKLREKGSAKIVETIKQCQAD